MTEVTCVPLQPIGKGALAKLWLGVAALALAGAGIAYAAIPPSVQVETLKPGKGPSPTSEDISLVNYKGTLPDGRVFDQREQYVVIPGQVVPGFVRAVGKMQRGGRYRVVIPAELGYGSQGGGAIPPDTDLTFEMELLDFKSRAEIERQQRLMEQLQQMQQMQSATPGAVGPDGTPPPAAP